eukprot:TRINITY_DN903_c0_g1_i1.p1 TRINITY_DN903_c0_g1~~TRINITY_DN903_c0_g1_i1.p1  ORF type:complete len:787 (-),score=117.38 TRINITY_DN903_c0_g1_i1:33-2393(-)
MHGQCIKFAIGSKKFEQMILKLVTISFINARVQIGDHSFQNITMKLAIIFLALFAFCVLGDKVVSLTDANYKDFLSSHPLVLLKLFAPWCGHCKKMAPEFEKAAEFAISSKKPYALAEIDCDKNIQAARHFNITRYPTIKLIKNGTPSDYSGDRSAESFVQFLDEAAGIPISNFEPPTTGLVDLGDSNYTKFFSKHKLVLVKIYAPWCGHCKKLAPDYKKAALYAKKEGKPYILAEIDGTIHRKAMSHFNVSGYPTLKLIHDGNVVEYQGGRTFEDLIKFLDKNAGLPTNIPDEYTDKQPPAMSKNVVVLNDANYKEYLEKNKEKPILLKLYAPWCGHCKSMAPEFEKAAELSKEQGRPYVFAEIDAAANQDAAKHFDITGFPTLFFLYDGKKEEYNEGRNAQAFLQYMIKKAGTPMVNLKTVDEVKKVLALSRHRSILVSDDPEVLKEYKEASTELLEYSYYYTSVAVGKKVFPKITSAPVVVMINAYGEEEKYYVPTFNKDELEEFLIRNENPTVITHFTQPIIGSVFPRNSPKTGILMFRSAMDPNADQIDAAFRKAAQRFKDDKYVIGLADINVEGFPKRMGFFLSLSDKDLPSLEIIRADNELKRYVYRGPMNEEAIYSFVKQYEQGKAKRFFKSEAAPAENNGPVYKVVGTTFENEVLKDEKDVVVNFYAAWDGKSIEFKKMYNKLANKLQNNKKIKFVEIDITKNDVEGHPVRNFPTIKVFPGKNKGSPETYTGEMEEDQLLEFLKVKGSYPIEATEQLVMPLFTPLQFIMFGIILQVN